TKVLTDEVDEQRRGVDAAVVVTEGDLSEIRHLAPPALVEDLAGGGVPLWDLLRRLVGGEVADDAPSQVRLEPEALEGCDDAVTAEGGAEPGDAGVGVRTLVRRCREQVDVVEGALQPGVQEIVRGGQLRAALADLAEPAGRLGGGVRERMDEAERLAAVGALEGDGRRQGRLSPRLHA